MSRNITRSFSSILFSKVGLVVLTIITTPILVRLLGSKGYGDYAFVISMMGLIGPLIFAGIFNGIRKYVAEQRSTSDWESTVLAYYARISALIFVSVSVVIILLIYSNVVENLVGERFELYLLLMILLVFSRLIQKIGRSVMMGFGLEQYSEPLLILNKLLFMFTALPLVYYGWGVAGALVGQTFAVLTSALIILYIVRDKISWSKIFAPLPEGFPRKSLRTFGFHSILLGFLTVSLYHVDILLLQPIVGGTETGYYKAALVIAEFLWFVPTALQNTLVQSISEIWSKNDQSRVSTIAANVTRYSASLLLILIIGLAVLAPEVIRFYFGPEFISAVVPLYLLLPGAFGFALARPIFAIGQGMGNLKVLIYSTGLSAVINLLLNLALIPAYGMNGAAVATSIGYGSMLVFHVITARRIGFDPISDLRAVGILASGLLTFFVLLTLSHVIQSPVVSLVVIPPIGFLIYSYLSIRTGVFSHDEIQELANHLPRPGTKIVETVLSYV